MKVADLSLEAREKITQVRFDRIVGRHEGPFDWDWALNDNNPEFLTIDDLPVLLPIPRSQHPNVKIVRSIWSADGNSVTIFLTDTTYDTDWHDIGFLAVCDKVAGEEFWLAIVYHEWMAIEPAPVFETSQ